MQTGTVTQFTVIYIIQKLQVHMELLYTRIRVLTYAYTCYHDLGTEPAFFFAMILDMGMGILFVDIRHLPRPTKHWNRQLGASNQRAEEPGI